jgi:hypothetical protein
MKRKHSITLLASISCIFASAALSGCATYASEDYEAIFIGNYKVLKQDERQPLLTATIHFDKDRNGYIALQAAGQTGYTSVHLWACRSFDRHRSEHDVQEVRCGSDDGQMYWFDKTVISNENPGDSADIELAFGQVNLYSRHYLLTRIIPTS